jgi:hypothetical protein
LGSTVLSDVQSYRMALQARALGAIYQ